MIGHRDRLGYSYKSTTTRGVLGTRQAFDAYHKSSCLAKQYTPPRSIINSSREHSQFKRFSLCSVHLYPYIIQLVLTQVHHPFLWALIHFLETTGAATWCSCGNVAWTMCAVPKLLSAKTMHVVTTRKRRKNP